MKSAGSSKGHRKGGQQDRHGRIQRARRRALQALYQWQLTQQDTDVILKQFRQAQDMSTVDEEFFENLLRGVIDEHQDLNARLQNYLDRPMQQVDPIEQVVLRIGAWQLLHRPDIPYRVVLDESVDLAHRFGAEQGHAFVNGVLDKAAREWRPDECKIS
jgi:N utilization substance protein B